MPAIDCREHQRRGSCAPATGKGLVTLCAPFNRFWIPAVPLGRHVTKAVTRWRELTLVSQNVDHRQSGAWHGLLPS